MSKAQLIRLVILLAAVVTVPMQAQQTDPATRLQWYESHVAMKGQSLFKNLPWQFLGPTNVSGRMTDIAVPRGGSYTIYAAGATGGVWKTVNEGTTWFPVFEQGPSTSIGDVTVDPSNPNTVWVGTGEANIFRSSHAGAGVFKSTDGGETWQNMGLTGTHTIPRIVVDPTNSNVVYVAASGHEWTNNEDRGVYKTTDGGESWEKILYINEMTGAIDLVMIHRIPTLCMLRRGSECARSGTIHETSRTTGEAVSTRPRTRAPIGRRLLTVFQRPGTAAALVSMFLNRTPTSSTRLLTTMRPRARPPKARPTRTAARVAQ